MNYLRYIKKQKYSVFIFLLTLTVGVIIAFTTDRNEQKLEKERAGKMAEIQAGKIQHVIENLLFTAKTTKVLLSEGNGEIKNFNESMHEIIGGDNIRSISLAPDGVVSFTYPLAGNESAIGHNILQDPARRLEANTAKYSRELTLAGPYTLRQGGFGVIGRLPVYFYNTQGTEYFWGFVCVVLDLPEALEAAQMEKLESQQYAYELWRENPDTQKKQIIMKSREKLHREPQEESFTLPNSTWFLSITPVDGWLNTTFLMGKLLLALIFAVLASLLSKNVLALAKSRNDLNHSLLQQTENYKQLDSLNEELKMFRHDVKNHMISLSSLLDSGNLNGARDYVNFMSGIASAATQITNTENYVFDALLSKKISLAKEKQIQVESEVFIGKQLRIENEDWSILFGNAIDNAIEACELIATGTKRIHIYIQYKGNILQTRITNTMMPKTTQTAEFFKTTKKDPQNHGLGLKQMQTVIKKYNGVLETSAQNEIFILSFLLFDV